MNIKQMEESAPRMNLHLRLSLQETRLVRSLAEAEQLSVTGYLRHLIRRAGVIRVRALIEEARRS